MSFAAQDGDEEEAGRNGPLLSCLVNIFATAASTAVSSYTHSTMTIICLYLAPEFIYSVLSDMLCFECVVGTIFRELNYKDDP